MSKLFKRAKVQYTLASSCYKNFATDDVYIDACCYSLQQAIELTLKYIVELNGEEYAENHDIRANLKKLERLGVPLPGIKQLRSMASTLYSWETESRYNDDFVALLSDIDEAMEIAKNLIEYTNELVSDEEITEMADFPDKRLS